MLNEIICKTQSKGQCQIQGPTVATLIILNIMAVSNVMKLLILGR